MSIARDTGYNVAGAIVPIIVALVATPLYLELIGSGRYGLLALAALLTGYFGAFDLGLAKAATQRIAALRGSSDAARATSFWSALAASSAMGVIGGAALYWIANAIFAHYVRTNSSLRQEVVAALPYLAARLPVAVVGSVLSGSLRGRERFLEVNVLWSGAAIAIQAVPLLTAWLAGPELRWLMASSLAVQLVALAIAAWLCGRYVTGGGRVTISRKEFMLMLSFGGWVTVSAVFGSLMLVLDRFLIGAMISAAAVTIYTLPYQIAQRVLLLPSALQTAMYPRQAAASGDEKVRITGIGTRAVAVGITPIVVAALYLIGPFLKVWVGGRIDVELAGQVGRMLLLSFWCTGIAYVPFARVEAEGRARVGALVHLAELAVYAPALIVCVMQFGLAGVAIATAARCFVDAALFNAIGLGRDAPWKFEASASGLLLISAAGASLLRPGGPAWIAALVVGLAASMLLSMIYAPQEVQRLLVRPIQRFKAAGSII